MTSARGLLDVIIPFHGRPDLLLRCLRALAGSDQVVGSVFLVDDGSPPLPASTWSAIHDMPLPLRCIRISRRRGFVEAVNTAWTQSRCPTVLVLNSDAFLQPDTIGQMCAALDSDGSLGAIAPASTNPTDLFQYRRDSGFGDSAGIASPLVTPVSYLTGMCLAVRARAVETPWLFDPAYSPGYFEDLDLSCRMRASGWRLGILESCRIEHLGRGTFGADRHRRDYIHRNFATFSDRWGHLPQHQKLEEHMRSVH